MMQAKHLTLIYNVLFIVTMLLLLLFIGLFVLYLVVSFADYYIMQLADVLLLAIILLAVILFVVFGMMLAIVIAQSIRFTSLLNCHLDPDAAMDFFVESRKMIGRRKKMDYIFLNLIHDLQGDYAAALNELEPYKAKHTSQRQKMNLAYYYLRCGKPEDAKALVQPLDANRKIESIHDSAQMHTMGLYYLETGNPEKAKECFTVALYLEKSTLGGKMKIARLNSWYDLARLEEKEGNSVKAIEHYQQAASLGPKAWLGQEAGRRAETLWAVDGMNKPAAEKVWGALHKESAEQNKEGES